jgi:excisionase family DNA binding protein
MTTFASFGRFETDNQKLDPEVDNHHMTAAHMMTVPEVAGVLRLSRSTVYELLGGGQIASVVVGSCRRVRYTDLCAYVHSLPVAGIR